MGTAKVYCGIFDIFWLVSDLIVFFLISRGPRRVAFVGSIPAQGNELLFIKMFISAFCYKGKKEPGDEFRHSTCNGSKIRRKVGNGVS